MEHAEHVYLEAMFIWKIYLFFLEVCESMKTFSEDCKILTSLSIKKEGLIELEPMMQYVSSLLRSELCAREDPCDSHLIGVFGCIPQ